MSLNWNLLDTNHEKIFFKKTKIKGDLVVIYVGARCWNYPDTSCRHSVVCTVCKLVVTQPEFLWGQIFDKVNTMSHKSAHSVFLFFFACLFPPQQHQWHWLHSKNSLQQRNIMYFEIIGVSTLWGEHWAITSCVHFQSNVKRQADLQVKWELFVTFLQC